MIVLVSVVGSVNDLLRPEQWTSLVIYWRRDVQKAVH